MKFAGLSILASQLRFLNLGYNLLSDKDYDQFDQENKKFDRALSLDQIYIPYGSLENINRIRFMINGQVIQELDATQSQFELHSLGYMVPFSPILLILGAANAKIEFFDAQDQVLDNLVLKIDLSTFYHDAKNIYDIKWSDDYYLLYGCYTAVKNTKPRPYTDNVFCFNQVVKT